MYCLMEMFIICLQIILLYQSHDKAKICKKFDYKMINIRWRMQNS